MNKYDFGYTIPAGSSNSWAYKNIKPNSYILEFGPSNGILTKHLKEELNCTVDIVEINEEAGKIASQFSRNSCIGPKQGNIENYLWLNELRNNRYDYIIFLDVVEHLYDGSKVLESAKMLLKEEGNILVSVPNIAHNSVIINLINNKFEYTPLGLLDDTHIRFFTYTSLTEMVKKVGLSIVDQAVIQLGVGENEIINSYENVAAETETLLRRREMGDVYQFLFKLQKCSKPIEDITLKVNSLDITKWPINVYLKQEGDKDFTEEKVLRFFVEPQDIKLVLDLSHYKNIQEIRIDILGTDKILKNTNLYEGPEKSGKKIQVSKINGVRLDEETIVIFNDTPQLIFDLTDIKTRCLYLTCRTSNSIEEIDCGLFNDYSDIVPLKDKYKELHKLYLETEAERARVTKQYQLIEKDRTKLQTIYMQTEKERERVTKECQLIEKDRAKLQTIYLETEAERARVTKQYQLIEENREKLRNEYEIALIEQESLIERYNILKIQKDQAIRENEELKCEKLQIQYQINSLEERLNQIKVSKSWRCICMYRKIRNTIINLFRR